MEIQTVTLPSAASMSNKNYWDFKKVSQFQYDWFFAGFVKERMPEYPEKTAPAGTSTNKNSAQSMDAIGTQGPLAKGMCFNHFAFSLLPFQPKSHLLYEDSSLLPLAALQVGNVLWKNSCKKSRIFTYYMQLCLTYGSMAEWLRHQDCKLQVPDSSLTLTARYKYKISLTTTTTTTTLFNILLSFTGIHRPHTAQLIEEHGET